MDHMLPYGLDRRDGILLLDIGMECVIHALYRGMVNLIDEVDHPAIKGMYDTFHANIEEKDPVAAIKAIKKHMIHVHISENDRGTPGKGHVPWAATYKALRAAKYDGWLTIEAFGRAFRRWRRRRACGGIFSRRRRAFILRA